VLDLSYPNVKSIGDIARAVGGRVKQVAPGGWIQGRGWDEGKLAERRLITARDLDPSTARHPA
jgi:predicted amidohydrolase YtcJ